MRHAAVHHARSPVKRSGLLLVLAVACAPSAPSTDGVTTLGFAADAPLGGEIYSCFSFARSPDEWVRSVRWEVPASGALSVHHATLYAVPSWDRPDGAECWDMPGATGFAVWVPGVSPLVLPAGMGLTIPKDSTRWVVQLHAFRSAAGAPERVSAIVETTAQRPAVAAGWAVIQAPVPAIRPHMTEQSSGECRALGEVHVGVAWPHMHRAGKEFHGQVIRGDGSTVSLVDVPTWDVGRQVAYTTSVDVHVGDRVRSTCVWDNVTGDYVLPGPLATDEMCHQAILVWPVENSRWDCGP